MSRSKPSQKNPILSKQNTKRTKLYHHFLRLAPNEARLLFVLDRQLVHLQWYSDPNWVKWYPDSTPFETLISQLMSSANDQRLQAESLFHLCRDLQPDALAGKLATTLHSSSHHEIRAMSAILLRKLLTRDSSLSPDGDSSSPSYLWPRLLLASQASLKSLLLASVQREEVKSIAKKLCDTVSKLAAGLLPDDAWPELLPLHVPVRHLR